jgi:hypothetical protein
MLPSMRPNTLAQTANRIAAGQMRDKALSEFLDELYLAKTPAQKAAVWACAPARYLDRAWHASPFADDGAREYLTFASPAEFASRNIFTEERPLRRARGPQAAKA